MKPSVKIWRNGKLSSFVLTILFVSSFAIGPHQPIANLVVLSLGISVMLAWVNRTILMTLREGFDLSLKKLQFFTRQLEPTDRNIQKLILERIRQIAEEKASVIDTEESAKAFCHQAQHHLQQHRYDDFADITTQFAKLETTHINFQYRYNAISIFAIVTILIGSALQIREQLSKTGESKWISAGSGSFAAGFGIAALYYWFVSNRLMEHQTELKLMRQILKDKHGLFSQAKALTEAEVGIVATASPLASSNPLLVSAAGAGAGGATAAGTGLARESAARSVDDSPSSAVVSPINPSTLTGGMS